MKPSKLAHKRRPPTTKLGKIFRALRNERNMNMEDMAADLGYSKSYLSQVETGKTIPSMELLKKYIDVYQLNKTQAYKLFITAYENYNQITIKMNDLRILDREHFSRLLAIVKIFEPAISQFNLEAHNLKDAINAIWKINMP